MNIPPHENVEPIVIQDEPKLKIRLLPKREKRKTTTPDEPDKKKSKITLEASSQDADIVTDVFNRQNDNCLNQIIDGEMNISPKESVDPIVIQDEPKLKIRLLPKREKRKAKAPGELNENKCKIILEDATQKANTITNMFNKKEDNCVYQIIDDDPEIKINLLSCRRSLPHSIAIPNKYDVVKNVCESALNKTFGTYKPEIKIHQHLVIRQPNKELNILENITDSDNQKLNTEPYQKHSAKCSDTLQKPDDGIQCAKGIKSDNQVQTIVINEEPGIKIKLLPRRKHIVVKKKVTEQEEGNYSYSNEIKSSPTCDTYHEESHSTKDEDSIKWYCESQSDFPVDDETFGTVSPKQIEATGTIEEEKNKCKVVNEIVINDEPAIKINLLSKKRQGKTTSITKTDECEAIKSSDNEKKLPRHEESHSIKDEDSIKLYCESQSDFPVNDETFGTVSPKQIEATGTIEEEKNECKVVNEIVINDEPTIKINLLPKKRQGKTTSISKTDKCEAVKSRNNEKKLPKHEEKMFDDKNETHCKADCSTKGQDSFKSYYESICDVQVSRARTAANFHLSEVESSQETVEKRHITPKPTDNLIKKSCDDLDIVENVETTGINSERTIEVIGSVKEGTNNSINEDNGSLQILIDEEPTIKINLLPTRKQKKTKNDPEAEKSLENEKDLLDNQLRYGVKNDSHWEDTDSMKDQDSSTCLQDIARVAKSGNVEESGLQEAQYNKEVLEKPLALQAAANLFQKSFDIPDLTENNKEDIEATIKNELKRVNESNITLQMVVIDDEPKTKVNLLSKSNKKPLNHFENSKTACKTVDKTEDFISSKSFVEDHSKSLLDTFLNLETQYRVLNSILPEVSGDCKDSFEPVTNLVSETLANHIETDEDNEATTDKNDQMETNVNDRHKLVQEINDPCDTKEDSLARDTDFEKHCNQVDSNVTQTVFSKDEGLEEVESFGTGNDGINENTESGALLEGNGTVLVYPTEKSYTTVVKRKICYELDEENIQTKDHQDPMVQSACDELESVELEMPVRTEIQKRTDITHNKKKSVSLIECEVSSKIVVIDEEPKIKINFLSRAKKKSQLTLCVEANDSTLDNVTNSKNEEPIEESVGDKQITKCSEQYLGQKCPTNSVENKGEGKLGCQTDTIVINEEPKIKINFLSKRKKK